MSISSIYEAGKFSMMTNKSAINTTSQNISNISTEGYTRRRVDVSALNLRVGGLNDETVRRMKDRYLENQLRFEKQELGKNSTSEKLLTQIESIFDEPHDSALSNTMKEFWNSWANLANNPENASARSQVKDKAVTLANTFNRLDTNLKKLQINIGSEIQEKVNDINGLANQIKSLNEQLWARKSDDLLDRRDILLDRLSQIADIQVTEGKNGSATVASGGHILVSGNYTNTLQISETEDSDGVLNIKVVTANGNREVNITSGELGGYMDIHNNQIPDYITDLNTLAVGLKDAVNTIHNTGYDLSGTTNVDFFVDNITGASDIAVANVILTDPNTIATSAAADTPGDGSIAQLIADEQNEKTVNGIIASDHYNNMISKLGNQVKEAKFIRENQERVVQQLNYQKESVSGVSIDEEMTNLIKYEQAYQAAARMIGTVDTLMETVLNMV